MAPSFDALAEDNEIALSSSKSTLTFQGHPELTNEIARLLGEGDDGTYTKQEDVLTSDSMLLHNSSVMHDGIEAWAHIMRWASS